MAPLERDEARRILLTAASSGVPLELARRRDALAAAEPDETLWLEVEVRAAERARKDAERRQEAADECAELAAWARAARDAGRRARSSRGRCG